MGNINFSPTRHQSTRQPIKRAMAKIIWGTVPQGDIIPMEYFVFWSVGGVMVFLTAALIISRLIEFTRIGIQIRDRHNLIFLPLSSTVYRIIMAFPLIASILKNITFVSPLFAYTAEFVIKSYEGLILRFFTQVLVLYLGTIENTMTALGDATPTKYLHSGAVSSRASRRSECSSRTFVF